MDFIMGEGQMGTFEWYCYWGVLMDNVWNWGYVVGDLWIRMLFENTGLQYMPYT